MRSKTKENQTTKPRKSLGQNFLINKGAALGIIKNLNLSNSDIVLEIGAGKGALTGYLLEKCKKVVAVEIDKRWCEYLKDKFQSSENLIILNQNILNLNLKKYTQEEKIKIVGNIPYHLTAPIISYLIENKNLISQALLTVQKEVANRICAKPGSGDWSLLSIFTQLYAQTKLLFVLKPSWFFPQPKVHSAVVELVFLDGLAVRVEDVDYFFKIAKMMFQQKRKMIINSLASGLDLSKSELKEKLKDIGIDPSLRPQELGLDKLAIISSILR
ncbi:MAG: 16S rRNA (adenine(1518)-N(6)/adenine(1519)-N(6))-dimethyltransferase RsmA [candidate division Zixibacteria bacterium]|nr:16S rRNA (adenine(1518)-N(6)/adenine(1519)-N(6))-dimethyltransferase RsmA [candidate division Zixibacteria bacterium]